MCDDRRDLEPCCEEAGVLFELGTEDFCFILIFFGDDEVAVSARVFFFFFSFGFLEKKKKKEFTTRMQKKNKNWRVFRVVWSFLRAWMAPS